MAKKTYKVTHDTETFDDIEGYEDVEVECVVGMSLGKYLQLGEMNEAGSSDDNPFDKTVKFAGSAKEWAENVLVKWNLVDADDEPIPADGTGFLMLPSELSGAILARWTAYLADKASDAEKKPSANGSSASSTQTENRRSRRRSSRARS